MFLKLFIFYRCRNFSPAAGCFLQHQCIPWVFWAGLEWPIPGHEVMRQLLLLSQVPKTAKHTLLVDSFLWVHLLIVRTLPTDTTNWSGVLMEWMEAVTHLASSLLEARTVTSSCMIQQRSWLERVMWSLLRVTSTRDQWELWTSTHFR